MLNFLTNNIFGFFSHSSVLHRGGLGIMLTSWVWSWPLTLGSSKANHPVTVQGWLQCLAIILFMYTGLNSVEYIFDFFSFETTISTLSSGAYWKLRLETDQGQETNNPHLLAARIIRRGGPITHIDVNSVLAPQGISVTEAELNELKSIPFTKYELPVTQDYKQTFPRSTTEGKWGIYMFTNTLTDKLYVGSSIVLGTRLLHYWKKHTKTQLRPILNDIRTTGLQHFTLSVCVFPVHLQEMRLLLALEQYYILSLTPQNNALMVVNASPGGKWLSEANSITNSVPITMHHNDEPIYVFNSMNGLTNNALSTLKIKSNDLINVLNSGNLL